MANKKIFNVIVMILIVGLCLGVTSAEEILQFDNIKQYDADTETITIVNTFGIGRDITELKLNTPKKIKVSAGYQKVAEFEIEMFENYTGAFNDMVFYDLRNNWNEIDRQFDYKYKVSEWVDVNDYGDVFIGNDENGTAIYKRQVVGTHQEKRDVWYDYDLETNYLEEEKITLGIFTNVEVGDYVEWIPEVFGIKIDEWASWTQALETDLTYYYEFEETSGSTAYDSLFDYNGSHNGAGIDVDQDGKIGRSYNFSSNSYVQVPYNTANLDDWTFSAWVQLVDVNDNSEGQMILSHPQGSSSGMQFGLKGSASGSVVAILFGGVDWYTSSTHRVTQNNTWYHVVFQRDGTNVMTYINNVQENLTTGSPNAVTSDWYIGMGYRDLEGKIDEFGYWDRLLTRSEIEQLYNDGDGISFRGSDYPTVDLNTPANETNFTSNSVTFGGVVYDDTNVTNVSLIINNAYNETNTSSINNSNYTFTKTFGDGDYTWTYEGCDNESQCTNGTFRTFHIDATLPTIDIYSPNETYEYITNGSTLYLTGFANDTNLDSCWYDYNGTNTTFSCTTETLFNESLVQETINQLNLTFWANDTFGNNNSKLITWEYYIWENEEIFNNETVELSEEEFTLNITLGDTSIQSVNFWYNNTAYSPTITSNGNERLLTQEITVPDIAVDTNFTFFWEINLNSPQVNTTAQNQTASAISLDNCTDYTNLIINMSLVDEETQSILDSTNTSIEIETTLFTLAGTEIDVLAEIYEDTPYASMCLNTLLDNYSVDIVAGFYADDHVNEFWFLDNGTLRSNGSWYLNSYTLKNVTASDLLTTDSTSFLFNYFDQDGSPVEDAIVHVFRQYIGEGLFREVERSKADENGDTIVHLVEEDVIYYFMITLYGEILYTSSTYTALCQATPCTITIEASGEGATFSTDWDLINNGAYTITEDASSRTVNLTYSLNATSTMNLTVYKYLSDGSYSVVETGSDTGSSGDVLITVPQSAGNVSFFATVYQDDEFINSEWVDFNQKSQDRFGITLALFLGALIILTLGLMAVSEGVGTLVFVILGVLIAGFLGLITTKLSTGVNIVVYLVLAGGILLWKLTRSRR